MAEPEFEFFGEPRLVRLQKLLDEIRRGEIEIPRFQRPFVWTDEQRLLLMDSVYRGYPIGSILVWRTKTHQLATHEHLGPLGLPGQPGGAGSPRSEAPRLRQYLLDGHQRMTTLFAALGSGLYTKKKLYVPLQGEVSADDPAWPIYFDLEKVGDDTAFVLRRKHVRKQDTWLPLDILFDSYALGEWEEAFRRNRLTTPGQRELVNRARSVADAFRDYMVPVLPVATENLDQVTASFKRINSGGTPMNEEHMVAALTYRAATGDEFDLDKKFEVVSADLQAVGWGEFDRQMVLQVCKVRSGLDIYDEKPEAVALSLRKDAELLDHVTAQILRAAEALKSFGILSPKSLPYSYQAVLLADALADRDLSKDTLANIHKWIWITSLTEYFGGITKAIVNRARLHLRAFLDGGVGPLPPDVTSVVEPFRRFDFRGARARTLALLLAEQRPEDPQGVPYDAFALLAEHGSGAVSKLFREKDLPRSAERLSDAPENRFLVHPNQAGELHRAIVDGQESLFEKLPQGHLITEAGLSKLRERDFLGFLAERRRALEEIEAARTTAVGLTYRTDGEDSGSP